ncbi:hypothetical protein DFH06DRAFT_1185075, partial [Mycena polygramma]
MQTAVNPARLSWGGFFFLAIRYVFVSDGRTPQVCLAATQLLQLYRCRCGCPDLSAIRYTDAMKYTLSHQTRISQHVSHDEDFHHQKMHCRVWQGRHETETARAVARIHQQVQLEDQLSEG